MQCGAVPWLERRERSSRLSFYANASAIPTCSCRFFKNHLAHALHRPVHERAHTRSHACARRLMRVDDRPSGSDAWSVRLLPYFGISMAPRLSRPGYLYTVSRNFTLAFAWERDTDAPVGVRCRRPDSDKSVIGTIGKYVCSRTTTAAAIARGRYETSLFRTLQEGIQLQRCVQ